MKTRLISYTMPYNEAIPEARTIMDIITYCARVSNPDAEKQGDFSTSEKLIAYLRKHKHWSPFEMADITLEVTATREIIRQMMRHGFRIQEFSQRYSDATEMDFEFKEARLQDHVNRQNSLETDDSKLHRDWLLVQQQVAHEAKMAFKWAKENGIAKEIMRSVMPEGLTLSKCYMKNSIRGWMHYIEVRTGPETQKEHRILARECAFEIAKIFPLITEFVQKENY